MTKQLIILNEEYLAERLAQPHTLCATGLPRGGTSSVALLLRELGFFMGDELIGFNHEDKRLQDVREDPAAFAAIARDYDARHDVWAFKLPVGARMLGTLVPVVRNPVLIAIMRSPAAMAQSRLKRQGSEEQAKFIGSFARFHRDWAEFADLAKTSLTPMILIQFERLVADPQGFAEEFIAAIGMTVEPEVLDRATKAISNPGYQRFSGDPDQTPPKR